MRDGSLSYLFEQVPVVMPDGRKWFATGTIEVEFTRHTGDGGYEPRVYFEIEPTERTVLVEMFEVETDAECTVEMPSNSKQFNQIWRAIEGHLDDECAKELEEAW